MAFVLLSACSGGRGGGHVIGGDSGEAFDLTGGNQVYDFAGLSNDAGQLGCAGETGGCYSVYACSDSELYLINLMTKALVDIGPFNAPTMGTGKNAKPDTITDLAVAPNGTIYVVSTTTLYTASPMDGHVTSVGTLTTCGSDNVALTFTDDGKLYAADYTGAFCEIGYTSTPITVTKSGPIGGGMAISGDIVGIGNGTMYGTAYDLMDGGTSTTTNNNLLIQIDPTTGMSTKTIGSTGYPELYGVSYALGQVFGFTHDGTGRVVTIDPMTGVGTLFNTFLIPSSTKGIAFAGAGVNSMVQPIQ